MRVKSEERVNAEKRRKRRIRNLVCATYCFLQLLLVLGGFQLLGFVLGHESAAETMEPSSPEIILGGAAEPENETGLLVCIDAGHGGKDNGSDYQKRLEKDDNLKLAQAVAAYLKEKDVQVIMTREEDVFLSLEERCNAANEKQADYFVSLHRNDGDGNGVETWVSSSASDETAALAQNIMSNLSAAGIQRNRGVKKGTQKSESGNYYVNLHTDMPSCIVEMGFMNNATDNKLFDEKLEQYAAAIGDAVLATYERYGEAASGENASDAGSDGSVPASGGEGTAGQNDSEAGQQGDQGAAGGTGYVTQTIDLNGLDTTSQDWGQGSNVDEKNRPTGALLAQEQYGAYNALFIGEDSQTIYLTFDEGYEYGCTESILDTLKEKGVKAVFFVTEPYAKSEPELVKRMIEEGHVVGNHSVTHPSAGLPSLSVEKQQNEVLENHQYIKDNFGYDMHLFRYPAGKFSKQSLAIVNNCNYKSVFWSFAYLDYDVNNQPDQTESLKKMVDKLHPGAVYLLHAESKTNAAVLGSFIDQAKAKGYDFGVIE